MGPLDLSSTLIIARIAYRSGVTAAISPPATPGFLAGWGAYFSLQAPNKLQEGAVLQDFAGIHVALSHTQAASVSSQISALRQLLIGDGNRDDAFSSRFVQACPRSYRADLALMFTPDPIGRPCTQCRHYGFPHTSQRRG